MIEKTSARKAGSAKKPKSTEQGQPPYNLPSRFYQKPEPAARQAKQSGLSQTSKTSDYVPHAQAEIVEDTTNGNGGDNSPYKRLKIPEDQIPLVLGLEEKPATKQRWWRWLFTPIDAKKIIKLLRFSFTLK